MTHLILQPTDVAQWYALVSEGQCRSACHLDPDLESYLVFMLMRYAQKAELANSVIALEYLESLTAHGQNRFNQLQACGDKSLLLTGLFPQYRHHLGRHYFANLGRVAYHNLSLQESATTSHLYAKLSQEFCSLAKILASFRE